MNSLARLVANHRRIIMVLWVLITVAGVAVVPGISTRLRSGFQLTSVGYTANETLGREFGGAGSNPSTLLLTFPAGTTISAPRAQAAIAAVDGAVPRNSGIRAVSHANTPASALVGTGGRSTVILVFPADAGGDAVDPAIMTALSNAAVAVLPGTRTDVTGVEQLSAGNSGGGSSVLTEVLIGAVAALLILAWVFGSALAVLPLLTALVSILAMLLAIDGLTYIFSGTRFNPAIEAIVAILGLGLSVDYGLLVTTRWREERLSGKTNAEAITVATRRAGHAVAVSGLTASVGLVGLILIPVSFVRGVALAGLLIPSIAAGVSLTLLPAVLATLGPRLERRSFRTAPTDPKRWRQWAQLVVRRRWAAAIIGVAVLGGLAAVSTQIDVALPGLTSLASTGPARSGLTQLKADGFPEGILTPLPVILRTGQNETPVAASLRNVPGVTGVLLPGGPEWHAPDGTSLVVAVPKQQIGGAGQARVLAAVRAAAPAPDDVAGNEVLQADNTHAVYSAFPYALILVSLITFLFLARAFRSLLLPLKAVILNLLSVAATYGLTVLIWQYGYGLHTLFGLSSTGAINGLAPVLLFGFLFGLSMDYEVFILSRMREAHDAGLSTDNSVIEGISRTGRLVTSAALILFAALVSLASAPDPLVKTIATGLAVGVMLDATIVRSLLAPALVSLFDRANWWLPSWAATPLRVNPPLSEATAGTATKSPSDVGDIRDFGARCEEDGAPAQTS